MSREIDRQIAEKVMGLTVHIADEDITYETHKDEAVYFTYVPCYSTNISDAWLVVGKIYEGLDNETGEITIHRIKDGWSVYIFKSENHVPVRGIDKSAPMAICKAALKSKEAE